MCTVSWLHTANGYELFCNRDEQRARATAWPPRVRERRGVRFSAPIDGASGGAWLGVNQFGLTLCLLNRYDVQPHEPRAEYLSRGWLLLELLACRSATQVRQWLAEQRLGPFQPFTLAAVQAARSTHLFEWDGKQLTLDEAGEARLPLTSSSFATASVVAARRQQFAQLRPTARGAEALAQFHRSHTPAPGAYSVCLHRDNAQTVSFSHLKIDRSHATFLYFPQAPCAIAGVTPYATRLELSAA